jgi:hypothetical protein
VTNMTVVEGAIHAVDPNTIVKQYGQALGTARCGRKRMALWGDKRFDQALYCETCSTCDKLIAKDQQTGGTLPIEPDDQQDRRGIVVCKNTLKGGK